MTNARRMVRMFNSAGSFNADISRWVRMNSMVDVGFFLFDLTRKPL